MKRFGKFNARREKIDGISFASAKEAKRYRELKLLERAGEISNLKTHPAIKFEIGGWPVLIRSQRYPNGRQAKYTADFIYLDRSGREVWEDTKGVDTESSRLRRAIALAMRPDMDLRIL